MKLAVVERYGNLAREASSCCGPTASKRTHAETLYSEEERAGLPDTALSAAAGCGNPVAMGSIREGQTVVDLGSGGGAGAFMAARIVGSKGKVIGIDMTPDMINLARENAAKLGVENVEFRLAEIEALPVLSSSVDVIIPTVSSTLPRTKTPSSARPSACSRLAVCCMCPRWCSYARCRKR